MNYYSYICIMSFSNNKRRGGVKDSESIVHKRREALQRSINNHKVNIDRTVFEKTNLEKQNLKIAKRKYKNR